MSQWLAGLLLAGAVALVVVLWVLPHPLPAEAAFARYQADFDMGRVPGPCDVDLVVLGSALFDQVSHAHRDPFSVSLFPGQAQLCGGKFFSGYVLTALSQIASTTLRAVWCIQAAESLGDVMPHANDTCFHILGHTLVSAPDPTLDAIASCERLASASGALAECTGGVYMERLNEEHGMSMAHQPAEIRAALAACAKLPYAESCAAAIGDMASLTDNALIALPEYSDAALTAAATRGLMLGWSKVATQATRLTQLSGCNTVQSTEACQEGVLLGPLYTMERGVNPRVEIKSLCKAMPEAAAACVRVLNGSARLF